MNIGILRQSTASQIVSIGQFLSNSDGNTEQTALTIANTDIKLHMLGATSLANKHSGGATHMANGIYYTTLDDTDTATLGILTLYCHVSGALAVKANFVVVPQTIYDVLIAGTSLLQVDVQKWLTQAVHATVNGYPLVDLKYILGTILTEGAGGRLAAAFIKLFNIASPTLTTGGVDQTGDAYARLGAAGAGLTSLGDTRIAHLDVDVSSRLAPTVAARTLDVSATGEAGLDWANIGTPSTNVDLSGTTVKNVDGTVARVALVDTTTNLTNNTPTIGTVTLATSQPNYAPAKAGDPMTLTGVYDAAKTAATQSSVNTLAGIVNALLAVDPTQFSAHALALTPSSGGAPTVQQIVDGVWDELSVDHLDAGSMGALQALITAILAKTNLITANNVRYTAPNTPGSADLTIWQTDDYTVLSGRTLPMWSNDDWSVFSLTTAASITFYYKNGFDEVALGTVTALDDTTIEGVMTKVDKVDLTPQNYAYVVRAVLDTAHGSATETLVAGAMTVKEWR